MYNLIRMDSFLQTCRSHSFVCDVDMGSGAPGLYVQRGERQRLLSGDEATKFLSGLDPERLSGEMWTEPIITFDSRSLFSCFPVLSSASVVDMRILSGGEIDLALAAKEFLDDKDVISVRRIETKMQAHLRACAVGRVNLDGHPLSSFIPRRFLSERQRTRLSVIEKMWERVSRTHGHEIERYRRDLLPFAKVLYSIESNGIAIDLGLLERGLKDSGLNAPTAKFFQEVFSSLNEWMARTKFNPSLGVTGRIKVEPGCLNVMSIPHGIARELLVSRFENGKIVSFDFNAISYRCLVSQIDDPSFRRKYEGCVDFHSRTSQVLFGRDPSDDLRQALKELTFIYMFGGSEELAAKTLEISLPKVRSLMSKLDSELSPVRRLRTDVFLRGKKQGYVKLPDGHMMPVLPEEHEGKVFGKYAQALSSIVFRKALTSSHHLVSGFRSRTLFSVHDEVVFDVHPEEQELIRKICRTMEKADSGEFVVKYKVGRNYRESSE